VTAVAVVSGLVVLLEPQVPVLSLLVLYILVVLPVAIVWGTGLAAFTSILSAVVFAYLFLPPIHSIRVADWRELVAMGVFLVTAVVLVVSWRLGRGGWRWSRRACRRSSRRCRGWRPWSPRRGRRRWCSRRSPGRSAFCAPPTWRAERYEPDGTVTGVAAWGRVPIELAVGTRFDLDGVSIARGVQETGGPVRVDSFEADTGAIAREARAVGIRSSVGCPIVVAGRLWG
jgi:uncharacterized protein DUF4118